MLRTVERASFLQKCNPTNQLKIDSSEAKKKICRDMKKETNIGVEGFENI